MPLTIEWVQAQIADARAGANTPQNVRDFALLCIARDNLQTAETGTFDKKRETPALTAYNADLTAVPTLDQVDAVIAAASSHVRTPQQRQRVQDAKTWADIIRAGE